MGVQMKLSNVYQTKPGYLLHNGLVRQAKSAKKELDTFQLFFDREMIQRIVISTNLQINRNRPESHNDLPNTSIEEINWLIGSFLLRGLNHDPNKRKHTELIGQFI